MGIPQHGNFHWDTDDEPLNLHLGVAPQCAPGEGPNVYYEAWPTSVGRRVLQFDHSHYNRPWPHGEFVRG